MIFEIENYLTLKSAVEELCEYLALNKVADERIFDSKLVVYELLGNVLQHSGGGAKLALELLAEKVKTPEISLSDIARKRNTSRQAVQQALRRKCRENPEIARLLANRERKSRQRKQLTFMEAVCQIRRQRSSMSWNAPATGSKFYRSLNCWNQNFDLSKMSILKGSSILRKD